MPVVMDEAPPSARWRLLIMSVLAGCLFICITYLFFVVNCWRVLRGEKHGAMGLYEESTIHVVMCVQISIYLSPATLTLCLIPWPPFTVALLVLIIPNA